MMNRPFQILCVSPFLFGIWALAVASVAGADEVTVDPVEISRRVSAMGTVLEVRISAKDRKTALDASEALVAAVQRVEARLSTWREDTELSRVNNAVPGLSVDISCELESNLREVGLWWTETDAAFDPGIASLVAVWGLRVGGRLPSQAELAAALNEAGYENLVLDSGSATRLAKGFAVEEGGFGKGVALREASSAALGAGATCVVADLGGQIEIRGACPESVISIADPRDRNRRLVELSVSCGSVATSGNSQRGLTVDGTSVGHLLNPMTGVPAVDWGSVTVVADDAVTADCVATALYVMGPEDGANWLRDRTGLDAVFVRNDGEKTTITATEGLRGRLVIEGEATATGGDPVIARLATSAKK